MRFNLMVLEKGGSKNSEMDERVEGTGYRGVGDVPNEMKIRSSEKRKDLDHC
jgi:hypothetical protein